MFILSLKRAPRHSAYMTMSITMLCYYAECLILFTNMLNVVMVSVVMLSVVILSVVMLNVITLSVGLLNVIIQSIVMLSVVASLQASNQYCLRARS
jgi:hypothetical protein